MEKCGGVCKRVCGAAVQRGVQGMGLRHSAEVEPESNAGAVRAQWGRD